MKRIFLLIILTIYFYPQTLLSQDKNDTQIMVLGTYHLNQLNEFYPDMLDNVVEELNSYNFNIVCVENMPTQLLYDIESRNDTAFEGLLQNFGGHRIDLADKAQKQYNISFLEAQKKANKKLSQKNLTLDDRKNLIKYFLASGDLASATLQYHYILEKDKSDYLKLDHEFLEVLKENITSTNEIYSLSMRIAADQDIQNIEYIDNFQDEALLLKYYPGFINDYMENKEKLIDISTHPVFIKISDLLNEAAELNDLYDLYGFLNSDEYMNLDYQAQWQIWFKTNFDSGSDLARYYLWEMRNLQIAANILEVVAKNPGKKILVVIGASHKSFLKKYLKNIPGIKLLKFQ